VIIIKCWEKKIKIIIIIRRRRRRRIRIIIILNLENLIKTVCFQPDF